MIVYSQRTGLSPTSLAKNHTSPPADTSADFHEAADARHSIPDPTMPTNRRFSIQSTRGTEKVSVDIPRESTVAEGVLPRGGSNPEVRIAVDNVSIHASTLPPVYSP